MSTICDQRQKRRAHVSQNMWRANVGCAIKFKIPPHVSQQCLVSLLSAGEILVLEKAPEYPAGRATMLVTRSASAFVIPRRRVEGENS